MIHKTRTPSSKDNWETPAYFFDPINNIFKFTLDPCSTDKNTKCKKHYTELDNGLLKDWSGEIVFCNPPYSQKVEWIIKCYNEGKKANTTVALLIPSATETQYFHEYLMEADEIWFITPRINFFLDGRRTKSGNTMGSLLVIFRTPRQNNHVRFICYNYRLQKKKVMPIKSENQNI